MNWIKSKERKPKPLKDDELTFVLISWLSKGDEFNFRDYDVIYYSPCSGRWFRSFSDENMPNFDNWCYITDPQC